VLVVAACSISVAPAFGAAPAPAAPPAVHRCTPDPDFAPLRPADKLNVVVTDHAELSGEAVVATTSRSPPR
jgi:protein involved in polysaccharide export with SLBB domain